MSVTDHRIQGLAEVARLCGISLSTVNRKVPQLRDYGAEKDSEGVWHVPVSAIEAVGWKLRADPAGVTRDMSVISQVTGGDMSSEMSDLKAEIAEIRSRLVRAEAEAEKWQAIAAERQLNLDDLRRAQRLLEGRTEPTPAAEPDPPAPEPASEPSPASTLLSRFRRRRGYGQ